LTRDPEKLIKHLRKAMGVSANISDNNSKVNKKTRSKRMTLLDFLNKSNKKTRAESSHGFFGNENKRGSEKKESSATSKGLLAYVTVQEKRPERLEERRTSVTLKNVNMVSSVHTLFNLIKELDTLKEKFLPERILGTYARSAEGYLLEVEYDGKLNKAVALIYDPTSNKIIKVPDRTGHKPYFLTNLSPEEIKERGKGVEKHNSFERFDVVVKFDPIRREKVKMTKIVVKDPLAVRSLREKFKGEDEGAWEADIKYHHNYIYDLGLIPGMRYKVDTAWKELDNEVSEEFKEETKKALNITDEELKRISYWLPLFEKAPPKPCIAAIDIEVYTENAGRVPDPEVADEPIISIAVSRNDGQKKVFVLYRQGARLNEIPNIDAEVEIYSDEKALLLDFLYYVSECPVIITFNGDSFDLPYIRNRMKRLGISEWAIGIRPRRDYYTVSWGVHIDLYKLFDIKALQTYAFGNRYREKNLDSIAEALIGEKKVELSDTVSHITLDLLIKYNLKDSELTLKLMTYNSYLVWNLIVLLMRISKLGIEDVTRTQVSGWIKSLLYWEHRRRGYLIPRKEDIMKLGGIVRSKAKIKDKRYQGAIVLSPPQGAFFNIVVLDFASLYPSIIRNWNLSYETVDNPYCKGEVKEIPDVGHKVCMSIKGITSEIVGLLRDFRVKIYKRKAKDKNLSEEERLWYDTVQSAMKVYINASYGVFGNESFGFFSLAVAESVTAIGRTTLMDALKKAEELNLHIVYGDTDSLFVWGPRKEAIEELIRYVKEKHGLELEVDKILRIVLFSGLKKNYIGITDDGEVIIKGMVGKKSNTPEFIKKAFVDAVTLLASMREPEDVSRVLEELRRYVKDIYVKLKNREYNLDELAFKMSLTKDLKEYTKSTPQHVKAALQLTKYGVNVRKGDIISFVKTKDGLGVRPVRLAKLSDVDISKYMDYIRTAFEQMLLAFGITWEEISGVSSLQSFLS
jgi:DNA polymerase I